LLRGEPRASHCPVCSGLYRSATPSYPSLQAPPRTVVGQAATAGGDIELQAAKPPAKAQGKAGGKAAGAIAKLAVGGMHCSSCSNAVEAALGALQGVATASVALTMGQANVTYNPALVQPVRLCPSGQSRVLPAGCGEVAG
jgi:P-type Cu+ transporter